MKLAIREELLSEFLYKYPNIMKLDQLMNSAKLIQLRKLDSLCESIRILCGAKFGIGPLF